MDQGDKDYFAGAKVNKEVPSTRSSGNEKEIL
jgi:hypothetical protein